MCLIPGWNYLKALVRSWRSGGGEELVEEEGEEGEGMLMQPGMEGEEEYEMGMGM